MALHDKFLYIKWNLSRKIYWLQSASRLAPCIHHILCSTYNVVRRTKASLYIPPRLFRNAKWQAPFPYSSKIWKILDINNSSTSFFWTRLYLCWGPVFGFLSHFKSRCKNYLIAGWLYLTQLLLTANTPLCTFIATRCHLPVRCHLPFVVIGSSAVRR